VEKLTKGNKTKIRHGRVTVLAHCTSINEINSPTKFLVDTSCSFRVMSWTKFKSVKNEQRAKAPTFGKAGLWFFLHCTSTSIYLQSFLLILHVVSELCFGPSSKCKN